LTTTVLRWIAVVAVCTKGVWAGGAAMQALVKKKGGDAAAAANQKRRWGKMRASTKIVASAVKEQGGAKKRGAFKPPELYQPGAGPLAAMAVRFGDDELRRVLAQETQHERNFSTVHSAYGSALRLHVDDGDAHARRGLCFLRQREEQMKQFFQTGRGGDPEWWARLDGLIDKAIVAFRQARNSDPDCSATHYGLACALVAKGEQSKAASSFCRAEQLRPARFNPRPEVEGDHLLMLTELLHVCTEQRGKVAYEQAYRLS
jgi:hypothetical protein